MDRQDSPLQLITYPVGRERCLGTKGFGKTSLVSLDWLQKGPGSKKKKAGWKKVLGAGWAPSRKGPASWNCNWTQLEPGRGKKETREHLNLSVLEFPNQKFEERPL